MAAPSVRFRIDFAKTIAVGPGKIDLLEAIRDSGSLSQAARDLGMSYRRAWLLLENMKQSFRDPVTRASTGGKGGGGVRVTQFGELLIQTYRELEREVAALAAQRLHAITRRVTIAERVNRPVGSKGVIPRRRPARVTTGTQT